MQRDDTIAHADMNGKGLQMLVTHFLSLSLSLTHLPPTHSLFYCIPNHHLPYTHSFKQVQHNKVLSQSVSQSVLQFPSQAIKQNPDVVEWPALLASSIIENNQPTLPWRDCIVEWAQKEGIDKYRRRDLGFVGATEGDWMVILLRRMYGFGD